MAEDIESEEEETGLADHFAANKKKPKGPDASGRDAYVESMMKLTDGYTSTGNDLQDSVDGAFGNAISAGIQAFQNRDKQSSPGEAPAPNVESPAKEESPAQLTKMSADSPSPKPESAVRNSDDNSLKTAHAPETADSIPQDPTYDFAEKDGIDKASKNSNSDDFKPSSSSERIDDDMPSGPRPGG